MTALSPLEISQISKSFKEKNVIEHIDLSIVTGEIFGLIGLNGVGKTTLIKIILNLLYPDQGSVKFFNQSNSIPLSRKLIAYLPEKFYPSQFLKGTEFLELSLSFYQKSLDKSEAEAKAELLELDPKALDDRISKYSKGMAQKLGLMSVFMSGAPLLILDEPMSGLDPSARIQLKKLIHAYKQDGGTTFFSSHILSDIEEICDRIGVIHNKSMPYIGTPKSFLKTHKEKNLEHAFLKAIAS